MRNICFFNSTPFWGGGEKAHLEYAINFKKKYQVYLVTSKGSILEKKALENGIDVISFEIGNLSFLNYLKIRKLSKLFKQLSIDTIFLNSSPDLKLGGLAANKAKVKNIVYMRGLAVPIKNSILNRYLLHKIITHPVPNSKDTCKAFLTHLRPKLNERNVPVIYRGINFKEWDNRPVNEISFQEKDEIILGNVGRLVEQKGQKYLIEIAKILKHKQLHFKLIIAGSGPLEGELLKLIHKNNLEKHVSLVGFQSDVKSFLNGIDIFLFTSLWEGFGNAMVEAMAERKVPVAFNLTSNPEIIEHGKNGYLIDFPNIERFTEKIIYLINNPVARKEMGEIARQSVIQKFDFENILLEWEKLLN
ncbi:glycosyltransferase [Sunxiuqinia sp. A32]|uniref:glycosyltransferase n=1 Tax=Sunxiuqinia sp. A32 TaxID=3461496 RepID=UPI0040466D09